MWSVKRSNAHPVASATVPAMDLTQHTEAPVLNAEHTSWGWMPGLSLVGASGVFMLTLAFNGARTGADWAPLLHWISLLVLFLPLAVRIVMRDVSRREQLGLLIMLGMALYLVKVLYSPLEFKFSDELQHWRNATTILETNHLFASNPFNQISTLYSGIVNLTVAVCSISGLSVFNAGIIIIGFARLVLILAIYSLFEQVSQSTRISGTASVIYMTSPHYQFFNSMFAYQSLALPLAIAAIYACVKWERKVGVERLKLKIFILICTLAVISTHHVTNIALVVLLIFWAVIARYFGSDYPSRRGPSGIALLAIVMTALWMVTVAAPTIPYLIVPLERAVGQVFDIITGNTQVTQVFRPPDNPLWERAITVSAVGLIALGLPLGLWQIYRYWRHNIFALTLGVGSLGYYLALTLRFSSQGAELMGRATSFIFLPITFVLALGIVKQLEAQRFRRVFQIALLPLLSILFLSSVTGGWPMYWGRLPGTYVVSGFERSIETQGVAAALWARNTLTHNSVVAADFTNYSLMGSYGFQHPMRGVTDAFFSTKLGPEEKQVLQRRMVRYVVADYRLSRMLPMSGRYIEPFELNENQYTRPLNPMFLAKFNRQPGVNRIFDSGDIVIYDLKELLYDR